MTNGFGGAIIVVMASRVSSPILIGRSSEFERLTDALAAARDGHGRAVLVAGEAGVGKTRLVEDFVATVREGGGVVLAGGCVDLGDGALPYGPMVEALRRFARAADPELLASVVGPARAELSRLVPDLAPTDSDAVRDGGPEPAEGGRTLAIGSAQGRLFELLLGVLTRLATDAPVALVIEDLHWSDQSTRDLLGFLVRNVRDIGVMLVLTFRSDELHRRHPLLPFLAELERTGRAERLELGRFDRRESAAQLEAIAGHPLEPALVDSIHARSGGNAFFAEELFVAAGEGERAELPATLRDVLLARVAELAEPTQEFLRVASAAGQRVDPALLAEAAGLDDSSVYEALREAVGRQVLVPDPTAGVERYAFRHALLQEAVYDDLLPGERTRLHSAFARTLERRPDDDGARAAELAYHWNAAHDLPRALESAVTAGDAAAAGYAYPEAAAFYERALELWDHVPDAEARAGRDRVELLADVAGVARFHEASRAVSYIQTAIGLVEESAGDPVRLALLYERLGRYAWIAGQGEVARTGYRTAMRLMPAEPPTAARARVVAGYAQIQMLGAHYAESREVAAEAIAIARAVGARDIEGHALNTYGYDRAILGEVDEAIADVQESLRLAQDVHVVDDIGRAQVNLIWIYQSIGRHDEAVRLGQLAIEPIRRLGLMRFFGSHLLCGAADDLFRLGRWSEADAIVRAAEDTNPFGINVILVQELAGRLAMVRGRLDEAAELLRPLGSQADRAVDVQFVGPVNTSLAELAIWQGHPADALARVLDAVPQVEFTPEVRISELFALGVRAAADAAELARARRDEAAERTAVAGGSRLLDIVRSRHAEVVAERPVFRPGSEAWLRLSEAEAERLHGRPEPDRWAAAVTAIDAIGRPYQAAYARYRHAEAVLASRGDRSVAADVLAAAHAAAAELGAEPLRREIVALAGRARLELPVRERAGGRAGEADADRDADAGTADRPTGVAPPDPAAELGLTAREREVLALVALGRTNRQIADELFISGNTAGVHVSNILGKLGVAGRGEAAAIAHRLGLVNVGPTISD